MKKKIAQRCIKVLSLLLCVALLSDVAFAFCRYYDYNVTKMAGFYAEPEDTLDVVFIGASEVFSGFSSAYAYEQYGFTSYPYALDASTSALYASQLTEILKHQDPKWIVVEINGVLYDDPAMHTDTGGLLRYLNNIPFSWNKVRSIMELVPAEEWYYYFFPLAKYHSTWKEAWDQGGRMKDYYSVKWKGSVLKGNVTTVAPFAELPDRDVAGDSSTASLEPESEAHLRGFLELCREKGLKNVLFVRFPHVMLGEDSYERFRRGNEAQRIIEEYGYPFINMEREPQEIGLDFSTDFYNEDHTNIFGQQKITDYLGRLLVEEYGLTASVLTEEQRRDWETAAEYNQLFYDYCEECFRSGAYDSYYETRALIERLEAQKQS